MRSPSYRRRARANDLRISVRDDVQDPVEDADLSDSDDEGEPDTPSPTTDAFPSPTPAGTSVDTASPSISPSPTSLAQDSSQPTTLITSANASPTQASGSANVAEGALAQDGEALQAGASDVAESTPGMSKEGAIAFGTIGGLVIVAAIIFMIWKCRRRRGRGSDGSSSRSRRLSGFTRMGESRRPGMATYAPPAKTQSKIMDDLMAAAYAAEDGDGYRNNMQSYGAYADEKQQLNASMYASGMRRSVTPGNPNGNSNSLYVNQLLSGFYKGQRTDGLTLPPNARMPPPAAPSVAGQTEVTATTESTWRTWGWSQQKKPKEENWIDKCIRLGGLR
ncbi:hypothetical protein AAE478_006171 [Parahypoxylon ruwenzoriense]